MRAQKVVGRALVHERDGVEIGNGRHLEGAFHEVAVVQKRRAVQPLPGAWQRVQTLARIKGHGAQSGGRVHGAGQVVQRGLHHAPALQCIEQRGGHGAGVDAAARVVRHDHQAAIALAVAQGREFHGVAPVAGCSGSTGSKIATARVTADGERCKSSAARVKLPVSATARNAST